MIGIKQYPETFRKFTLIEMLVVIAIIGILASMLMPSLMSAMETAVGVQCASNQKQVVLSIIQYSNDYSGDLPDYGQTNLSYWTYPLTDYLDMERDVYRRPGTIFYCTAYEPTHDEFTTHTRTYGINPNIINRKWGMSLIKVKTPTKIALYGDKMPNGSDYILVPSDPVSSYWGIYGITSGSCGVWTGSSATKVQAYWRHNKKVNFAFSDGHSESKEPGEVCYSKTEIAGTMWSWFNW